ncbi:hypothetical protein BDW22DRAFT_1351231 [Trametopsis cervina]|nr:hypothetical protein BDW22DRAFT_1351231 [Trametopsis cervina]
MSDHESDVSYATQVQSSSAHEDTRVSVGRAAFTKKLPPQAGADTFFKFAKQVTKLDDQLRQLCNKACKLGGSAGILSASNKLRRQLKRVLYLFRENACRLYPEINPEPYHETRLLGHTITSAAYNNNTPKNLALEFNIFSTELESLFECFGHFSQLSEASSDMGLASIAAWDVSLKDYEDEFHTQAMQQFLFESMPDIGRRLERLTRRAIPIFTKAGIPTVQASQNNSTSNLQNLTVVSTLFAGVASAMLQVAGNGPDGDADTPLNSSISLFWYLSLVFSISATVNGLLGLSWMQAIYRSPDHLVPYWLLFWIKRLPFIFLISSVACFFIALIIFVWHSQEARVTSVLTIGFSVFSFVGIAVISTWFLCEWQIYQYLGGRMWLSDAIKKIPQQRLYISLQPIWNRLKRLNIWKGVVRNDIEQPVAIEYLKDSLRMSATDPISAVSFWFTQPKEALSQRERNRHLWREAVRRINAYREAERARHRVANNITDADARETLQRLTISQPHYVEEKHSALIRSLNFSPDGKYLLTSSWDSKSFLLPIHHPALRERVLHFPRQAGYIHQAEWSPNGNRVVIRSNRLVLMWEIGERNAEKVLEHLPKTNDVSIRSTAWHGSGDSLYSIEGRSALTLDISGKVLRDYSTQHLHVRDICVTRNSKYMLCVGKNIHEDLDQYRNYSIIVWDLQGHKVAKRVPMFHEISNITLARDDRSVLISYEHKVCVVFYRFHIDILNICRLNSGKSPRRRKALTLICVTHICPTRIYPLPSQASSEESMIA